ncbi:flagellar biosynthesis protein FlgC [Rheinheimera riviphila]|uniref:Flagellar biosynthesis protein FlgC n=1 Tax=Rheinheimera riviphila TaxID=1834037 RepID=A0A437QRC5_9GAMM|nr:flagellar basal body rod C-terminal domain-containing protein [Rheinheimera riviphila]RVU37054.1 flagellar biosynthesis protein FlgC [Rheinheimera riviphila]
MADGVYQVTMQGLATERARIDAANSNIANMNAVASTPAGVYQSQTVVATSGFNAQLQGYEVIREQKVKAVHQPDHPLSDMNGVVYMPDIDLANEMLRLNMASRAYEANIRAFNSIKEMNGKALEIGK